MCDDINNKNYYWNY